jgi:hypothetical protein
MLTLFAVLESAVVAALPKVSEEFVQPFPS